MVRLVSLIGDKKGLLSKFWCRSAPMRSSQGWLLLSDDLIIVDLLSQISDTLDFSSSWQFSCTFLKSIGHQAGRLGDTWSHQNLSPSWLCQPRLALWIGCTLCLYSSWLAWHYVHGPWMQGVSNLCLLVTWNIICRNKPDLMTFENYTGVHSFIECSITFGSVINTSFLASFG